MKQPHKSPRGRRPGQVKAESIGNLKGKGYDDLLYGSNRKDVVDWLKYLAVLPGFRRHIRWRRNFEQQKKPERRRPECIAKMETRFQAGCMSILAQVFKAVRKRDWKFFQNAAQYLKGLDKDEPVGRAADPVRFALMDAVQIAPEITEQPMRTDEIMELLKEHGISKVSNRTIRRAAKMVGIPLFSKGRPPK
jgi:hypothetical protein